MDILNDNNIPVRVRFDAERITVDLIDGRAISAPLAWYDWLSKATDAERAQYQLGRYSIVWPELGEGIDLEYLFLGPYYTAYVTVSEMAAMHGVAPNTIHRILQTERDLPESERRIPGAVPPLSRRDEWRIPRAAAQSWRRDPRGRPQTA